MAEVSDEEYQSILTYSEEERQRRNHEAELRKVEILNQGEGVMRYFDCRICRNKGYVADLNDEGFITYRTCECEKKRECYRMMEQSGINPDMLKRYTFQNFIDNELWQKDMKHTAMEYAKSDLSDWLVFSGQSGSGKTHLCTAVSKYLLGQGHEVKYMLWGDVARRLTALKFNEKEYDEFFRKIVETEVLYLDDFFKTYKDPQLAYNVINARYAAREKRPTIISMELNLDALRKIDEAVAGRIRERSQNFCYQIKQDPNRNYRYRPTVNN